MLDEELSIPKASDQTYIAKVLKAHGKHPRLIAPKFSGTLQFGIRHFAGNVTYSCEGFLEKNDDKLPDDAVECLRKSELTVLQEIAEAVSAEVKESSGQRGKKVQTVSVKFRKSLASLMDKLNTAQPHFIRCVKPNPDKRPFQFVSSMTQEQLVYSGVMEAVRIWQLGYSTRLPFDEFVRHFECLVDPGPARLLTQGSS
ncbi:unnamed protein product [Prorocentrum cordatum]|uniref:Myosin motor domain-containing protein n=1 Tax=Prorocentrum cordatum TaxID=2364126 RepID=A0ABN9SVQ3_9DINO|nr:unnamed protein product [Polarella glacialis]